MITNERQYRITRAQLSKLKAAAASFDMSEATKRIGSKAFAKAELDALKSEVEVLSAQIADYEALKSGSVTVLEANSLEELPSILIRARIARGFSQRKLADKIGVDEQQIQRYEAEEYSSASFRRLKEVAEALNLSIRKVAEIEMGFPGQTDTGKEDTPWERFPIKEMYRRNWFEGFTGSMAAAIANQRELVTDYVKKAMARRQPAFLKHRVRYGKNMNECALWAWECRILLLARQSPPGKAYSRDLVTEGWLRELAQASRFDDGPRRAREMVAEVGIPLIVEPHLSQTYLDGAALLSSDGNPVIGMTLRYDRLDNFWFVLFHELIHVTRHLRKGKLETIFDDLDAEADDLERESDVRAGAILLPETAWETALARYVRTEESIKSLAKDLRIHPSVIAGRIRKEANNYVILNELVGHGEVRKHFPEVRFGQ